jgi:hypothetical protein
MKPQKSNKKFWQIFTVEFVSLSILEVLLILLMVAGGVFYTRNIFQKEFQELTKQIAYDRTKIADTTNILLALREYTSDKGSLPENLEELRASKYLDGNFNDPEFGRPYYYKKVSSQDYVLCVYLSTGVWGTNVNQCPSKEEYLTGNNSKKN